MKNNECVDDTMDNLFMVFTVENQKYAIAINYIIEIIEMVPITKVPFAPTYIKGIINLRSNAITVMDIRNRFGIDEIEYNSRTCIIIVEHNFEKIGFIVDSVNEIMSIYNYENMDIKLHGSENVQNFIKGVSNVNDEIQLILNCESIINIEEDVENGIEE